MSSEPRERERSGRRFQRRLIGTLIVLGVLAATLAAAAITQGPRLTSADIDTTRATQFAGASLNLTINQPVRSAPSTDLRIDPPTPSTLVTSKNTVTITFDEPLRYGQKYTVELGGLTGTFQTTPVKLDYQFTTADQLVYSLVRRSASGRVDAIESHSPAHPAEVHEVLTSARIQEFARVGPTIFAVTLSSNGSSNGLIYYRPGDRPPGVIALPAASTVDQLHSSTTSDLVGFRLMSPDVAGTRTYENALFIIDDSAGKPSAPEPVLGLSGTPIKVSSWVFVPGTKSVVVQDYDQSLFLVDTTGAAPISPLGRHAELRGFIPGTDKLILADPTSGSTLDLQDGKSSTLNLPPTELSDTGDYPGKLTILADGASYLQTFSTLTQLGSSTSLTSQLVRVTTAGTKILYQPETAQSRINDYCLSPNGQYVAIETVPTDGHPDTYYRKPGYGSASTTLIRSTDGKVLYTADGAFSDWCTY